ncbi:MAG: RNA 3'-terminal phosphate cyclase, partial [Candidatus Bathyarchaeia archaeon]
RRSQPGLRPQHLEAVLTAAKLCKAEVEGAKINSKELWFKPKEVEGGRVEAEIGTAGSIPMLLMTVLPICLFSKSAVQLRVLKGGTDVPNSPTINYMRYVFIPVLRRMGVNAIINVQKYGYYPRGMGEVILRVEPCNELKPLVLESFGTLKSINGISLCTFLAERRVAERQAAAANKNLSERGYKAEIQIVNDKSNPLQKGSSLVLWAESDKGAVLGADSIGEIHKPSETIGKEAAEKLLREIESKATVDVHLADMLILYIALAKGRSAYLTRTISDHLETNIWLAETLLGVKFKVDRINGIYKVEKAG